MNPQKNDKITKQVQEQHMEDEDSPQTLESPTTISRMGNQSVSIATSTDTQQRNANQRKKKEKQGDVSSVTKKGIQPRTVKEHSQ